MKLYSIPDIRLFWCEDAGVLKQFDVENPETLITYQVSHITIMIISDYKDVFKNPQSLILETILLCTSL